MHPSPTGLVALDSTLCPNCAAPVSLLTVLEPALLRGGGYGATRKRVLARCSELRCGYPHEREVSEVRP